MQIWPTTKNLFQMSNLGELFIKIWMVWHQSTLIQFCALVLRRVYNFSAWPGRHLERCNTHDSLAPLRYWLEVSKKVKHGLVPKEASKLQDVKVWNKNFKIWHLVTLVPLEIQGCVLPFWKPLYQYLKWVILSWLLQCSKHQPRHAENCIVHSKLLLASQD